MIKKKSYFAFTIIVSAIFANAQLAYSLDRETLASNSAFYDDGANNRGEYPQSEDLGEANIYLR